jgi:hypothetical protein
MATLATTAERWLADEWEKLYRTAVLSGIVGDLAHKARGGYHISREDQPKTNYSVIRPDDKPGNGPSDRAAAIDMTMSTADMKTCHTRLRNAWKNRATDPRMKYLNGWNGWDGQGDAGRYDVITGNVTTATPDHKWHIHLEIRRKYVNDMNAMRAILSILKGESASAFQTPGKETGVSATDVITALKSADGQKLLTDAVVAGLLRDGIVVNEYSDSKKTNPSLAVATTLKNIAVVDQKLSNLASVVAGLASKLDLDESAIATALAANTAFIDALARGVASNLPEGVDVTTEELTTAVKNALRDGVSS